MSAGRLAWVSPQAADVSASPFLEAVWLDLVLSLVPGGGQDPMSYCSHVRLACEPGDLDGVVIFAAQRLASCELCAGDIRDEIEAARRRVCIRCDKARADGLHAAADLTGSTFVAVQLCDSCAADEGIIDAGEDLRAIEGTM